MTSFISRPIKGHDGTYSFIATLDAAPLGAEIPHRTGRDRRTRRLGKNPGRLPTPRRPNPPVDAWMLPEGGVHITNRAPEGWQYTEEARKELLW